MKRILVTLTLLFANSALAYRFEKPFAEYTHQQGPGLAISVVQDGKSLYSRGFGFAALGKKKTPVTDSTNFNLASNSKQFTAFSVLLLIQDGKVGMEDSVRKYIPEAPDWMSDIKVKHLIYHTSGLPSYEEICRQQNRVHNEDILKTVFLKGKLEFTPGSQHQYSNTGYVILSEIAQRVSRKSFPEFISQNIFEKLGMKKSVVISENAEAAISNRAIGYGEWPYFEERDFSPCNYNFGDGGVYTSLKDYQKWTAFLSDPSALLKPEFAKLLFEPGVTNDGKSTEYAFGWSIDEYKGLRMIAHSGAWVGFRSMVVFIPEKKLWVTIFSNYRGIALWDTMTTVLDEVLPVSH